MGWIWALAVVGSLIGAGAIADRRRYRGISVLPDLRGRARRDAVRLERARIAHLESPAGYSPMTPIPGGGGSGTGDGGGGAG